MNKQLQILMEIKEILHSMDVEFWLHWGTLLGIYRDNKLIDNDLDIATYANRVSKIKKCKRKFEQKGYTVKFLNNGVLLQNGDISCGIHSFKINRRVLQYKTSVLYIDKILAKYLYYGILRKTNCDSFATKLFYPLYKALGGYYVAYHFPRNFILPLKQIMFENKMFNMPNDINKYLEYLYGAEWNTPIKNEDYPSFVTRRNYNYFKGKWNKIPIVCPKCDTVYMISNPHKKNDNKEPFITVLQKCNCGHILKNEIFVKGPVKV